MLTPEDEGHRSIGVGDEIHELRCAACPLEFAPVDGRSTEYSAETISPDESRCDILEALIPKFDWP